MNSRFILEGRVFQGHRYIVILMLCLSCQSLRQSLKSSMWEIECFHELSSDENEPDNTVGVTVILDLAQYPIQI
ncbi:uncharacterized protein LY79DRAFT_556181 [Colletotrichum navitas]|uniref:Uncharacterized protein n=1 Tax=Colletotrichum navitas TaxID=681940 RepID=A0AAD8PYM9_9PEZI|nr:uncharacterized protein LY79DRAFT_556181 [Colletotrichum navitas]KAK1589958.1 hypothetical protein LY79DRAFT_556181 [Colletotrichum navitas]